MVGGKQQPSWILVSIDVWSRLWPSALVGRRSYRNTLGLFRDNSSRIKLESIPLITTNGFEFYNNVVRRVAVLVHRFPHLLQYLPNRLKGCDLKYLSATLCGRTFWRHLCQRRGT